MEKERKQNFKKANSRFAKAGGSCFYESEVLNSSFVHLMKFSAKNPRLRKAAKRYASPYETTVLTLNRQKNEQKYIQDRKASRTFSTFGFARHTNQRFAKPKELNLPNALLDSMELTEKLLTELQRRLKIGNRRGVHLNAIPANSRYKFDLNRLSHIDKNLPDNFIKALLSEQPLKFRISWKENVPDLKLYI
jgi:hypothetical protein